VSRQGRHRKPTHSNIKLFWEAEAEEVGGTPEVTIRDHYFRLHELHTLLSLIPRRSRLMDIGCGTGFGTLILARRCQSGIGVDYSEKMIQWAQKLRGDPEYRAKLSREYSPLWDLTSADHSKVEFMSGDVLNLELNIPPFDVITGQRILINLPSHDEQMKALSRLRDHALEGGWLFLTEATTQGHERTDAYRALFDLPMLEKYWHNSYVDESRLSEWPAVGWQVEYNLGFDTYMLLSKLIYPAACGHANCQFMSGANAAAMDMANIFRSWHAVQEIGQETFLEMYVSRIQQYNEDLADKIGSWIARHGKNLADWSELGHQRLLIARTR